MFKSSSKYFYLKISCLLLVLTCSFLCFGEQAPLISSLPTGLTYKVNKDQNHVVHILSIDPTQFQLQLVKAHNQVFGRATVPEIALRTKALAAINAGFFEIAKSEDGRPSGTLVIDGNIFGLSNSLRSLLQINNSHVNIRKGTLSLKVNIGKNLFVPDTINLFSSSKGIALYNHVWGRTSLTPFDRKEILIDKAQQIAQIVEHGDNIIPSEGWILSLPKSAGLAGFKIGDKVSFDITYKDESGQILPWEGTENIVMGIPLLVAKGQAVPKPKEAGDSAFVAMPHARTAIGVKPSGEIIIVVAEHVYKQPFREMTLEQAKNILRDKQYSKDKINTMTVLEAIAVIQKDAIENSTIIGLSLPDLAKLMVDLGCTEAINLDGGGSSTLFLNGNVMNIPIGDKDEKMGQAVLRPVSDAIVVIKHS